MIAPAAMPSIERSDRQTLIAHQGRRLTELLGAIYGRSGFYTRKLDEAGLRSADLAALPFPDDFKKLPFTTKAELVADQQAAPPWGTVLTEPIDRYTRYNQTSSTTGRPLKWLDTNDSWQWLVDCWKAVYRGARVGPSDRILFAFSFGPFLGFWTAFDAAWQVGAHAVPTGGMSSQQRLALVEIVSPTVVVCTPTYALRLAEVAEHRTGDRPLSDSSVRTIVVAGEPGGSIAATRERIERSWGARVIDHYGLTEVGPVSFECWEGPGFLHMNEPEYICEVLDPATLEPVPDGQPGELVITNLGRLASPVLRYRTGDVVIRRVGPCACGRTLARVEGGILTRTDDMINIRGVNVYPSAIESVVRQFDEVLEFRSTVSRAASMRALSLDIELAGSVDPAPIVTRLGQRLRDALGLTVPIHVAPAGSLPRFEMKARRFVIE
jgi:phenylacetate-CoA ligase